MTHTADHDAYIAKGFCPAIYIDDNEGEHWCRLWPDHEEPHVAPWEYNFPKSETMVRWNDGPTDVKWVRWEPLEITA